MKKASVLIPQLIVALIALAGSAANVVSFFITLPEWISVVSAGVMLVASALWLILYFVNVKKAPAEEPANEEVSE